MISVLISFIGYYYFIYEAKCGIFKKFIKQYHLIILKGFWISRF